MMDAFVISLRESLQCSALLGLLLLYPPIFARRIPLLGGAFGGAALGVLLSWASLLGPNLAVNEIWLPFRLGFEFTLLYMSIILMLTRPPLWLASPALALLGFGLGFFDFRAAGFVIHDIGVMKTAMGSTGAMGALGVALGFMPLLFIRRMPGRALIERSFELPSVLLLTGSLRVIVGGVSGIDESSLMIALQRGAGAFLNKAVPAFQAALLMSDHEFLSVPFAGLGSYLAGESMAMTLMVIAVSAPSVALLLKHFSTPDPYVDDIGVAAHRRLEVSFFRREFITAAAPMVLAFMLTVVSIHAANVSLNPLSEPEPVPVREEEGTGAIRIALADRAGDLSDGKLRKYLYYYGQKQVLFLAVMKPDGTVGLALDECEICRPANWNVDARGYAQRGENLVCKYCMTPIPIPTVNKPGGCNPIPLPFKTDSGYIVLKAEDLIRTYNEAQRLEKKGTHF